MSEPEHKVEVQFGYNTEDDPFYRYAHDHLQIERVARSKMKRTFLCNCEKVARDFKRSPKLLLEFVGVVMHCRSEHDKKATNPQRHYVLHTDCSEADVLAAEKKFQNLLVLCRVCTNPETNLRAKASSDKFYLRCKACGSRTNLEQRVPECAISQNEWTKLKKSIARDIHAQDKQDFRRLSGKKPSRQ